MDALPCVWCDQLVEPLSSAYRAYENAATGMHVVFCSRACYEAAAASGTKNVEARIGFPLGPAYQADLHNNTV